MDRAALLLLGACACIAAAPAQAEVYSCTSNGGAVTYQEIPCGNGERRPVLDVPSRYPATDTAARDRLSQRAAALAPRLEARRERESRETVARLSQPVVQAAPPEPEPVWIFSPMLRAPHHRFMGRHSRGLPFLR